MRKSTISLLHQPPRLSIRKQLFDRLNQYSVMINPVKCIFGDEGNYFLGLPSIRGDYRLCTPTRPIPARLTKNPPSRNFKIKDWTHQDHPRPLTHTQQNSKTNMPTMQLHSDSAKPNPRLPKIHHHSPQTQNRSRFKKEPNNKISNTVRFLEEIKLLKQIV